MKQQTLAIAVGHEAEFEKFRKATWRDVFLATLNNAALRSLVGIDSGRERVPGGTAVLKFRRLFEVSKLGEGLFAKVGKVLQGRDFKVGTGAVVDAPPHLRTQLDEECREGVSPRNAPDPQGSALVFRHDDAHRRGQRHGADAQRGGERSPQARAAVKRLWSFTKLRWRGLANIFLARKRLAA